jgi:poly(A) polymerase
MKIYLVGGAVRDELLGIKAKDLDYVMVIDDISISVEEGFKVMEEYLEKEGFKIHTTHPDMFTIRAKFPKGHINEGQDADFVLARKEIGYEEGTRRPILKLGTLWDDLLRRDFTINAIAKDVEGNIIDPFKGKEHLNDRILVTPQPALYTFHDDPLRVLRALRFSITKGFMISQEIEGAISNADVIKKLRQVVSRERIREELLKMMKHNTVRTIEILTKFDLLNVCFGDEMWLKPTFEKK